METRNFINGKFIDSISKENIPIINPANQKVVGNIDQALDMLMKAYNSNPNSYYIIDSLAWAYFKKKDFVKAAELMEEVIDMVPGEAISLDHL